MFARSMRFLAAPLLAVGVAVLTGLPDFTALERAVSKALAPGVVQTAVPERPASGVDGPALPLKGGVVALQLPASEPVVAPADQARSAIGAFGRRPGDGLLVPLYASFVGLQALDVHSTLRAIDRGGREANALMAPLTEQPAAFVAFKAGSTAGILYLTERVRRRSPTAAIVMMAAFNSAYAMVVTNNYRIGNRLAER